MIERRLSIVEYLIRNKLLQNKFVGAHVQKIDCPTRDKIFVENVYNSNIVP